MNKIHVTIGVYANGETKYNGVDADDLMSHIAYNKKMRFGRALIVDGECVYEGVVSKEVINKAIEDYKTNPIIYKKPTIPYQ